MLRCAKCGAHFIRKPFEFRCPDPDCGGDGEPTDIGREFFVKSIEIDESAGDRNGS
jgi:hydrogenase nickel incorporation protein HypA/HybF